MSARVGVELGPDRVIAVAMGRLGAAPIATIEAPWDPSRPAEIVELLREQLGATTRIGLAIGLGFLHVKQVKLPPLAAAEKRRILSLEPDRFFPVQDQSLTVSLLDHASLAFAAPAELLESWVAAFERWAVVDRVEAAPLSLARALGPAATGVFAIDAGRDEHGLVELERGQVRSVRRVPADALTDSDAVAATPPDATSVAFGVARGLDDALDTMLASPALERSVRVRRVRRIATAAVACAAALVVALWSLDRSRERLRVRLNAAIAEELPRAAPAIALEDRLSALDREAATIASLSRRRADPLAVLASLSTVLPRGVTVQKVEAVGDEWRIEGTASEAAPLVPLLDHDGRFDGVRFLSASSRYREGSRTYETFSIALRVRPRS